VSTLDVAAMCAPRRTCTVIYDSAAENDFIDAVVDISRCCYLGLPHEAVMTGRGGICTATPWYLRLMFWSRLARPIDLDLMHDHFEIASSWGSAVVSGGCTPSIFDPFRLFVMFNHVTILLLLTANTAYNSFIHRPISWQQMELYRLYLQVASLPI